MARMSPQRSGPRRHRAPRPLPPPSVEILDIAFHRASLATPRGDTKAERDRRRAELKIVRAGATVARHLRLETRRFLKPSLTPFEWSLVSSRFGDGTLDRALTRVRRAEERIRGLQRDAERSAKGAHGPEMLGDEIRAYYGRLSSFVREVDLDLLCLRDVTRFLDERPKVDPNLPTLVVAGFPNVGKSSLVARLSNAHPKVADYPFTTLSIALGHADLGFDRLQVVDTPGVLGRSRHANPAEVEAETTVRGAATVVLFLLDPTGTSGRTVEEQEELLERWRKEFPHLPILPVETKSDLLRRPNDRVKVSSVTGDGVPELFLQIRQLVLPKGEMPAMQEELVESPEEIEEFVPPPTRRSRRTRADR